MDRAVISQAGLAAILIFLSIYVPGWSNPYWVLVGVILMVFLTVILILSVTLDL